MCGNQASCSMRSLAAKKRSIEQLMGTPATPDRLKSARRGLNTVPGQA